MSGTLAVLWAVASCAQGTGPRLEPLSPVSVAVNETVRVPIRVRNGGTEPLSLGMRGPDLPGFSRVASVRGGASGGEFRYSPLASHVGTHEVDILLLRGGEEIDRRPLVVTVTAASDAAPVFLRPGAGGTYDLERDPCVRFDVEVRDDDSPSVEIRARAGLPRGAMLEQTGPKSAQFDWCPTSDQVAASERWTIEMEADDGEHEPTAHDYVVVLRAGSRSGCGGSPPAIAVDAPADGARVGGPPFEVRARVTDDVGLRDVPLLYYSTVQPEDPDRPDPSAMQLVPFVESGDGYAASVPLELPEGAEQRVWFVVEAVDNDDPEGTACDQRAHSPLRSFTAVGAATGGAGECAACTSSLQCASGLCAAAAGGARCLPACGAGTGCSMGSCGDRTTVEGSVRTGCGPVAVVCGGGGSTGCVEDGNEPNDTLTAARVLTGTSTSGQICSGNDDYYRVSVEADSRVEVRLSGFRHAEGDLDLQLLSASGTILASSAGVTDTETAGLCMAERGELYVRVYGYRGAQNRYDLSVNRMPGACCADDAGEDDDARTAARRISGGSFEGIVCPMDDDFLRFVVTAPATVTVTIVFDAAMGDLDLELYGPDGTLLGYSRGVTDTETVRRDVTASGEYVVRVYGFRGARGRYLGEVMVSTRTGCTAHRDCPSGQVCDGGSCRAITCSGDAGCPSGTGCISVGSSGRRCAPRCAVNADCLDSEACKWLPEGRFCGERGAGANGAACSSFRDCGGQRACHPFRNGYCARVGCRSNADCEPGTFCVPVRGVQLCAVDCWAADEVCRLSEGHRCDVADDVSGRVQLVCLG
ncbi:MAG: PPC domain-containing protein [Myxococcales bacterium]|nr:PPC domain-containing protein [Myxococcales bacterium]